MSKAYILNTGIITAIGNNTSENTSALFDKKAGITLVEILQTQHQFPVGEIKLSNEALASKCGLDANLPRTALLSAIAVQEAILPFKEKLLGLKIAFISGNTVGGMDLTEQFYDDFKQQKEPIAWEKVKYHECGAITQIVAQSLELNSWNTTISTACSSSANTIMMGAELIANRRFDLVIAGGADALSKFTINGFNALMILDKELCQPFDENRRGLNLGEGAAYLLMCSEKVKEQLQASPLGVVAGYANANDAHHQTASSPEGVGNQLAMKQAILSAGLQPQDIDYINLHGTGTANNDSSEGIAISHIFASNVPAASSTKAFTGHTLGAAGAVEAVFSVIASQHQKTLPHLRLETPIVGLDWQVQQEAISKKINHVLSNSFGFGGNCSALVISKP